MCGMHASNIHTKIKAFFSLLGKGWLDSLGVENLPGGRRPWVQPLVSHKEVGVEESRNKIN